MLTAITATRNENSLTLPIGSINTGYLVTKIDGLEPPRVDFSTGVYANNGGAFYKAHSRASRNVVISLELHGDIVGLEPEALRRQLYSVFAQGREVSLTIETDFNPLGVLTGRTESVSVEIFDAIPSATVSIICFDSDIVSGEVNTDTFSSSSGSGTITKDLIPYSGTVDTGFQMSITFSQPCSGFTVSIENANGSFTFDYQGSVLAGDVVTWSTVKFNKGVYRTRGNATTSILNGVVSGSQWPDLAAGSNVFALVSTGAATYSLVYRTKFGGV